MTPTRSLTGWSRSKKRPISITSWQTPSAWRLPKAGCSSTTSAFRPRPPKAGTWWNPSAFQNGQLVGYGKDVIEIKKVGLEAWFTNTSQNSPVFFGILAVVIAVGAGLLVGMIFKKGGHH